MSMFLEGPGSSARDRWRCFPATTRTPCRRSVGRSCSAKSGRAAGGLARLVDAGKVLRLCQGRDSVIEESLFTQAWPTGRPWRTGTQARTEGARDCD